MRKRFTNTTMSESEETQPMVSDVNEEEGSYTAIQIPKPGGYDKLKQVKLDGKGSMGANIETLKIPKENLVVVNTAYVGVNYADVCIRWGLYESANKFVGWPIVPGFEFSGTVYEIGDGVTDLKVGDKVFGLTMFGGYSTSIHVPRHQVYLLPDQFSLQEAGAFLTVALTAWYAMFKQYQPRAGDTVMIHSVAGGVGSMLAQLAKIAKLRIVGIVGSSHKVKYAKEKLSCDLVIDKSVENLWQQAENFSPDGYNAIFDANGYSTLRSGYNHLAPGGRLIVYGFHSMLPKVGGRLGLKAWLNIIWGYLKTPTFSPLKMKNKGILCFNLSFMFNRTDVLEEALAELLQHVKGGALKVPEVTVFPMSKVAEAHRSIESGSTVGKLVLDTSA